jgi:hypothetical protein
LLFGSAPWWWNAASLILVVLGLVTLHVIHARTQPSMTAARQAVSAR